MNHIAADIIKYHEATKHHYHRYARSPGNLDWENQPHPFRIYKGCEQIELPLSVGDPTIKYDQMYCRNDIPPSPFDLNSISSFLALSMGLSAWKAAGSSKWALRMNPSSGNLHPTEAHLIMPKVETLSAGVYHYSPLFHALEQRAVFKDDAENKLLTPLSEDGFFIGLTSIFWREAWKYGERAFRYCNHDVGHALAALSLSAALQGWNVTCLLYLSDGQVNTLLGLDQVPWDRANTEHPDVLCFVHKRTSISDKPIISETAITAFSELAFTGTPNRLSKSYVEWDAIDEVADRAKKSITNVGNSQFEPRTPYHTSKFTDTAAHVIRKRRSGVNFDGKGVFPKKRFFSLLERTLPFPNQPPFDLDIQESAVHLLLFIHRVEGITPGLYFFCREQKYLERLKTAMRPDFAWSLIDENLPLYLLSEEDVVGEAIQMSCHQDIAGMGCFAIGMISEFEPIVKNAPHRYRHLFWEAGLIGQVLYLEAEAHGFRGTGIGCYFDDAVHDLIGFTDNTFQSLYHFTIGIPVEDTRLTTLPSYHHLQR